MGAQVERDFHGLLEKTSENRFAQWRRYARSLTRNDADAEDVVQDAITNTLRLAPDIDSEIRVHHYVQRAIRNTALSLIERRRRWAGSAAEESLPGTASVLDTVLDQEHAAARRRLVRSVERNIANLGADHREIVENMLLRTPGMKLREMAELQGVTTPTIHYRLGKALEKLARLVREESR